MPDERLFPVSESFARRAWIDQAGYHRAYRRSLEQPDSFWAEQADRLSWYRKPATIRDVSYGPEDVHIRWFADGTLNASVNCTDRHLATRGARPATDAARVAMAPPAGIEPASSA